MRNFLKIASNVEVLPLLLDLARYGSDCGRVVPDPPQANIMRKTYRNKGVALTHGYCLTHKKLYKLYFSMRSRCEKPTDPAYFRYGARGITVATEWETPVAFCDWAVSHGYAEGLTLERVDNNGGYSPNNCAWVSRKAQARNRRSSRFLVIHGERKTLAEWAEKYGVSIGLAHDRLKRGWPTEAAFSP